MRKEECDKNGWKWERRKEVKYDPHLIKPGHEEYDKD